MAVRFTPHLIELAHEAALKSFWRKSALRQFLQVLQIPTVLLSSWAPEESKRDFLARAFAQLQQSQAGQTLILQMALNLSERATFPDLNGWEDSAQKIADAARAVTDLKSYMRSQEEQIRTERETEAAKQRAREENQRVRRGLTDISKLRERLDALHAGIGTAQAGYDFQAWFYDMLDHCEIQNRRPYVSGGRQIDGSLTHEGTTYLNELKFTSEQATATDIDSLRAKVEDKADNTMGIMISISGYSIVAVEGASGRSTKLLLLDAGHLYCFLTGAMSFADIISRVRRHASQTGEAYLAVSKFGG